MVESDGNDTVKEQCSNDWNIPGSFILESVIEKKGEKTVFNDGISGPKVKHVRLVNSCDDKRSHFRHNRKNTRQKYYP